MSNDSFSKPEEALIRAFRDMRENGRMAAEWRTLGKLANEKARSEEQDHEAKMMALPDQVGVLIKLYDRRLVERMHTIRETLRPAPPGVRDVTRNVYRGYRCLNEIAYQMLIKGLERMEQELGIEHE